MVGGEDHLGRPRCDARPEPERPQRVAGPQLVFDPDDAEWLVGVLVEDPRERQAIVIGAALAQPARDRCATLELRRLSRPVVAVADVRVGGERRERLPRLAGVVGARRICTTTAISRAWAALTLNTPGTGWVVVAWVVADAGVTGPALGRGAVRAVHPAASSTAAIRSGPVTTGRHLAISSSSKPGAFTLVRSGGREVPRRGPAPRQPPTGRRTRPRGRRRSRRRGRPPGPPGRGRRSRCRR
jgi:hypothetical protein